MKQRRVIYYMRLLEGEYRGFSSPASGWKKLPSYHRNYPIRRFPVLMMVEEPMHYSGMVKKIARRHAIAEKMLHE